MTLTILATMIFLPLMAGALLGFAEQRAILTPTAVAVGISGGIALIYLLHEGLPPLPPISSKHKLGYALLASPALVFWGRKLPPRYQSLLFAALALCCFLWLVQRPLSAGRFAWHWVLPLTTIGVFATLPFVPATRNLTLFAQPVTALSVSITATLVALLGGYLGLGQTLISLSAFIGGHVLALFGAGRSNGKPYVQPQRAIQYGLALLLVQLSTFATNLSIPAFVVLLALMCLPLADPKISRFPVLIQPFAFGALALLVGIPAILLALLNF